MCKWFVITIMKSFLLLVDILTPNHLNSGVHLLYVIVFSSFRLVFFFGFFLRFCEIFYSTF